MKFQPQHTALTPYIDHYWVVDSAEQLFQSTRVVYDYPGIRPEMILILEGQLRYQYLGVSGNINKHLLASHIHGEFMFDTKLLDRFVVVQFTPRSLSALQPFINVSAQELIKKSVCNADEIFGQGINELTDHIKLAPGAQIASALDQWFFDRLDSNHVGFVTEVFNEVESGKAASLLNGRSLQTMKDVTQYSYSTLERYFKKETGLTPKKYQTLSRYKAAVEEIYDTLNDDWVHYVHKYGYYDQSHFIKEVKRYSNFTPQQLLQTPSLRTFRPG